MRNSSVFLVVLWLTVAATSVSGQLMGGRSVARNPRILEMEVLIPDGQRPRYSPDGKQICFDRYWVGGLADVYMADASGKNITNVTDGHPDLPQRHHGACSWHPNGQYLVWNAEAAVHYADGAAGLFGADPGIGLYHQLWSMNMATRAVTQITHLPIKQEANDGVQRYATFNAKFSPDGTKLCWTQRYAPGDLRKFPEGLWRVLCAQVVIQDGALTLRNEVVAYTPPVGNYTVLMQILANPERFLMASNYDGQAFNGMDLIVYTTSTRETIKITDTPRDWEEGSAVTPNHRVVFKSDRLGLQCGSVGGCGTEHDYYLAPALSAGHQAERLTYFNVPGAAEYMQHRMVAAMPEVHPSGLYMLGTIGEDFGTIDVPRITLRIWQIRFRSSV